MIKEEKEKKQIEDIDYKEPPRKKGNIKDSRKRNEKRKGQAEHYVM